MPNWTGYDDIHTKVVKLWKSGKLLRSLHGNDEDQKIFPYRISLRSPSAAQMNSSFQDVRDWVASLVSLAQSGHCLLEWKEVRHRQLGTNRIPVAVVFPDAEKASLFISKKRKFDTYNHLYETIEKQFPGLTPLLTDKPLLVLDNADKWQKVLSVVRWMLDNPAPGIYLRQVTIPGVDTKFIEANKKLIIESCRALGIDENTDENLFEKKYGFLHKPALVRIRFLDKNLYINGLSDITVRADELGHLQTEIKNLFVVENDINALSFPEKEMSAVLFGRGYGFDVLSQCAWMQNTRIYYWGDIDTHGFAILNQFRKVFPQTKSILMDRKTVLDHKKMWVRETRPVRDAILDYLTDSEKKLYADLSDDLFGESIRLEQEFIPYTYVCKIIEEL